MPPRARTKPKPASPLRHAATTLKLAPCCTLREASDLKRQLLEAMASPELIIDGSAVERIDTAGLQLLAALALREKAAGRSLRWSAASQALYAASQRAGLSDTLALDAAKGPST